MMTEANLLQILACGEDSRHQFKRDKTNVDSIATGLDAFANSDGPIAAGRGRQRQGGMNRLLKVASTRRQVVTH